MLGPPDGWIAAARWWRQWGKLVRPRTTALDFIHDYTYWADGTRPLTLDDLKGGWG